MKNNRGEMTITSIILAILMIVLIIALTTIATLDLIDTYGVQSSNEVSKYDNYSREITNTVDAIQEQTMNDNLEAVGFFTKNTYAAGKIGILSIKTIKGILAEFARDIPILALVIGIIIAAIILITLGVLMSAKFRYKV